MSREMEGRVCLVTGASQGIGESIALRLAEEGCNLVLGSRRQEACEEIAEAARERGVDALAVELDVSSMSSVQEAVESANAHFEEIDFLVNNAGIARDNLLVRLSPEAWAETMQTNLMGVYHCTKAVLRSMLRQRHGRVVSISSIVGLLGNPGQTAYAASKAGIHGFTKSLAREVASRNITVNAVAPGYISTEMTAGLPDEARERLLEQIPLERLGTGADVAGVVRFLLSEEAAYITGQVISVDGGMNM